MWEYLRACFIYVQFLLAGKRTEDTKTLLISHPGVTRSRYHFCGLVKATFDKVNSITFLCGYYTIENRELASFNQKVLAFESRLEKSTRCPSRYGRFITTFTYSQPSFNLIIFFF